MEFRHCTLKYLNSLGTGQVSVFLTCLAIWVCVACVIYNASRTLLSTIATIYCNWNGYYQPGWAYEWVMYSNIVTLLIIMPLVEVLFNAELEFPVAFPCYSEAGTPSPTSPHASDNIGDNQDSSVAKKFLDLRELWSLTRRACGFRGWSTYAKGTW